MSASEEQRAEWLDPRFWDRLQSLEGRHQRLQAEHEHARRTLDQVTPQETEALRAAWQRYCEVIAELDRTTAEFESLRTGAGQLDEAPDGAPGTQGASAGKQSGNP